MFIKRGLFPVTAIIILYSFSGCKDGFSKTDIGTSDNSLDTTSETSTVQSAADSQDGSDSTDETGTSGIDDTGIDTDTHAGSDTATDDTGTETSICHLPDTKYSSVDDVHMVWQNSCPDIFYLNVVDSQFYNLGHIPGSVEIPWDSLPQRIAEVPSDRAIVIYCRKGVRSEAAYETLNDAGYSPLYIMKDGLEPWIAAGYETEAIN
ncbi:MAG: rhodanese-like domain-containing protein [Deltaproteobacteria bacterium]|nr:rhodanese-like domain-containing protein [Deltaproteobacteria bacterium]